MEKEGCGLYCRHSGSWQKCCLIRSGFGADSPWYGSASVPGSADGPATAGCCPAFDGPASGVDAAVDANAGTGVYTALGVEVAAGVDDPASLGDVYRSSVGAGELAWLGTTDHVYGSSLGAGGRSSSSIMCLQKMWPSSLQNRQPYRQH